MFDKTRFTLPFVVHSLSFKTSITINRQIVCEQTSTLIRYTYDSTISGKSIFIILFGFKQHVTINHNISCKAHRVRKSEPNTVYAFTINDDGRLTPQLCFRRMNEKWRNLQLKTHTEKLTIVCVYLSESEKYMYI